MSAFIGNAYAATVTYTLSVGAFSGTYSGDYNGTYINDAVFTSTGFEITATADTSAIQKQTVFGNRIYYPFNPTISLNTSLGSEPLVFTFPQHENSVWGFFTGGETYAQYYYWGNMKLENPVAYGIGITNFAEGYDGLVTEFTTPTVVYGALNNGFLSGTTNGGEAWLNTTGSFGSFTIASPAPPSAVPEPGAAMSGLVLGIAGAATVGRRRRVRSC